MADPASTARMPRQIPFIIGNEACERFSFYGMRNILTVFLIDYLLLEQTPDPVARAAMAKANFHIFVSGVYAFPVLGGYLADRYFGKYRIILWLSLVYCVGQACLAFFVKSPTGFYAGLFLIALGSGGIKPCVSAMVGDQFTEETKHLAKTVFAIFYWSINFGSFFASLLIPMTLRRWGPEVAFGVPGVLMFVATFVFWAGRRYYVTVPPTGRNPHSFLKVMWSAMKHGRAAEGGFLDRLLDGAKKDHPAEMVDGCKAVFRVTAIFLPVPFFWMLFDQKASTWVVQAKAMDLTVAGWTFEPSQMQLVNPLLVMLLIPFTTGVAYPLMKRLGFELTPLRRMVLGMVFGAASFVVAGLINIPVEAGEKLTILWQILPYVVLTIGEILISTTGLEFAYTQAPREMKGTIMSVWLLTSTAANLAVALASRLNVFSGSAQFFYYAGMAGVAAVALALISRSYKVVDYFQKQAA
jgi:POT family proton-dependent oligopeptide transporter